jgi:hypothetical protein
LDNYMGYVPSNIIFWSTNFHRKKSGHLGCCDSWPYYKCNRITF